PRRERLQGLLAELDALRDEVAQLELECETLRAELAAFEIRHRAELAGEQRLLQRIGSVVRQLERWAEMLAESQPRERAARARRVERQRTRELHQEGAEPDPTEDEALPQPAPAAELKSLYRRLARRFHPDLARTEEEQVRHAALMARINALYRAGDRAGLEALADQALGAELPEPGVSLEEEVRLLEERRARFESARDGLRIERAALRGCATAELFRRWREAEADGRDFFDELRVELAVRGEEALREVRDAAGALEDAVRGANRRSLATEGRRSLARAFDPMGRQRLVRLSLEALQSARSTAEARAEADRMVELARSSPAAARLVLFAFASELVPQPLDVLRTYDDLALRFDSLGNRDEQGVTLERALVDAAELVEFGIRRAGERLVQSGLRFRSPLVRDAVPLALRKHPLRVEFRRVLSTLGERTGCPECQVEVFAVPLYRLRGLDDLHASACPRCGHLVSSYFLPRGKDVQSVLNTAFLDLELLTEWSFRMGAASVSVQLVPVQVERMTVGQLKRRFWSDVLERHAVPVPLETVRLLQARRPLRERRKLAHLDTREFVVSFGEKARVSVSDALETVKHRIRTRFRVDAARGGR
ncbi:MAG TPA: J domain-containing protein, partial [Myxococcaceae bacterium]|nr:J domain-containing protein [Myxococcaceae bacterium]